MGILDYLLVSMVSKGIRSARDGAEREKEEAKLARECEKAGMNPYNFVLSQLTPGLRDSFDRCFDNPDKMDTFLQTCLDQRVLTEYRKEVVWEEYKGQLALKRLQATGGLPWRARDILKDLAPEKILNQCDKDADSYGLQIVYLDQQVVQENVTRPTADLILNIYKLAREE